ncbi:aminopeptidase P family protein [bacterium]|nr:aminopeptidase P family protein [bacterium]
MMSDILFDPQRAQRLMNEAGIDLLLASRRSNVAYLTGCFGIMYWEYPEVAHMLDTEDDGCQMPYYFAGLPPDLDNPFVVSHDNRAYVFKDSWVQDVRPACAFKGEPPLDKLADALRDRGLAGARIGVELSHLPAVIMDGLRAQFPKAKFVDAGPVFWGMRSVKTPPEQARQRQAYRVAEEIYREVFRLIANTPDLGVADVRALIMAMATKALCPPPHFGYVFPQDGSSKFAWNKTAAPTYRFERGDVVLFDLGGVWQGYTTDFGRNAVLGKPSPELRDLYRRMVHCREAIAPLVVPGKRVCDLHAEATVIRDQLTLPALPSIGHSLGIECHEQPSLTPHYNTVIEENMTLVIELVESADNIAYLLEDAGVVTKDGWHSLTVMGTELVEL